MSIGNPGQPRGPLTHCARWILPPEDVENTNRVVCRLDRGHDGECCGAGHHSLRGPVWVWWRYGRVRFTRRESAW